ncbi:hypothetical protein [Saccharothrix obliqua]|uniref:hypothetical protein n=1 Tax=Saccharothrix obliqua TaxID=2861747 RepID=UPI001C5F18EF|nr:hypothetical protein [Saccharothrix obliqua]MBW4719407.1 hypothetical protein [Saccharothrix obliqua]
MIPLPLGVPTERRVNVIVTCANRKLRPVPDELRLGSFARTSVADRLERWVSALERHSTASCPADLLYGGEHWQVARTLGAQVEVSGWDARTWVCSAGYGLVPVGAPLKPYGATFATAHEDSVGETAAETRSWWEALTGWDGPAAGPRSLEALAGEARDAAFVVVLSPSYLRACADDLLRAIGVMESPDRLSIVSIGGTPPRELREFVLPGDAHLQTVLGGSLGALNVRVAQRLLRMSADSAMDRATLAEHVAALASSGGVREIPRRQPMSDDDVRKFIMENLSERSTHTSLLRKLRDSGLACEQKRFARLFAATVGG